ncbi:MAG: hypothetical protein ABR961_01980 [Thermoanaerobaculaceae bacterium]|jgi:hypothetical protein
MKTPRVPEKEELKSSPLVPAQPEAGLGFVIGTMRVDVVATGMFELPSIGIPIMREDFVTESGLMTSCEPEQ